jgi:hypothetical protein
VDLLGVALAIQPVAGALAGNVLATTTSGLVTGLVLTLFLSAATVLSRRRPT